MSDKSLVRKEAPDKNYCELINNISSVLEEGRRNAFRAINEILVKTYWEIGKKIVEYGQENKEVAGYGSKLFENIAKDLRERHGKGFSRSNVIYMCLFYIKYSKGQTLSDQLTWGHYVELMIIDDDLERS